MDNKAARVANIIIGAWLFISAFIWPHSASQFTNTWLVGALCVLFAAIALRFPAFRWANAALAVWLFISVWTLPSIAEGTVWHNAIVAIVIFLVALVPTYLGGSPAGSGARPPAGTSRAAP